MNQRCDFRSKSWSPFLCLLSTSRCTPPHHFALLHIILHVHITLHVSISLAACAHSQIIIANMTPEEQQASVQWMREAEIKHARLAMLAAVGWPLAELINPWLTTSSGRAPSLFNGGLGDGPVPFFLVLAAGAAAYGEYVAEEKANDRKQMGAAEQQQRIAGDFGFDPIGFSKEEGAYRQKELRSSELFNGRLAMLAITGFAVQEFLWTKPVVEQTPFFFGK